MSRYLNLFSRTLPSREEASGRPHARQPGAKYFSTEGKSLLLLLLSIQPPSQLNFSDTPPTPASLYRETVCHVSESYSSIPFRESRQLRNTSGLGPGNPFVAPSNGRVFIPSKLCLSFLQRVSVSNSMRIGVPILIIAAKISSFSPRRRGEHTFHFRGKERKNCPRKN